MDGHSRINNSGLMCAARGRVVNADLSTALGVGLGIGGIVHDSWREGHDSVGIRGGVATGAETC